MLRREAAAWLVRLQSGSDPDAERKFRKWRDSAPRHAEAFDRVRRSYEQAGLLRHSRTLTDSSAAAVRPRSRPWPELAAAAAIALLLPLGMIAVKGGRTLAATDAVMLTTRAGEIRQTALPDGSRITLDTATKLDVEIGTSVRTAHLHYGRARFRIAQASTPFVVRTSAATIVARQGVIDVEQRPDHDRVQVIAGAADVQARPRSGVQAVALSAGEAVTVTSDGAGPKGVARESGDWTSGMLQFDSMPLGDAVALANRYGGRPILLSGNLDDLRLTGAFRAGDTAGLARALQTAFGLVLDRGPDGSLVLSRPTGKSAQKKSGG